MLTFYTCPVCAYRAMTDPVEEGNICPCCGTEFGYDDDLGVTYRQLRELWIQRGMPWFSPVVTVPEEWNPILQLVEADFDFNMAPDFANSTQVTTERMEGSRYDLEAVA